MRSGQGQDTDAQIGDTVLLYEAMNRKSTPRWRGSAKIVGVDETGETGGFQGKTFKVARYFARKTVEEKNAEEVA